MEELPQVPNSGVTCDTASFSMGCVHTAETKTAQELPGSSVTVSPQLFSRPLQLALSKTKSGCPEAVHPEDEFQQVI